MPANYAFSPVFKTFYSYLWKSEFEISGTWPADAVDVTDEVFNTYSVNPPEGMALGMGPDNLPCWVSPPPLTKEEQIEAAESEKQRRIDDANAYINGKQWPGKAALGRLKGDELSQYNLWLDYLDLLDVVDTSTAPDIEWPVKPE
ncbi:TPA: tail fiber assembly protein [Salmonella enterica]|nr:tail fiber assembly protein [Salmonella enterica]